MAINKNTFDKVIVKHLHVVNSIEVGGVVLVSIDDLGWLEGDTEGLGVASKAILLDSNSNFTWPTGTLEMTGAAPIEISGAAVTKGINFAGAVPAFTDADDAFIAIGTWNDGLDIENQAEHFVPIQVHLDSKTSVAKDIAAARLRVDTEAANTLTAVGCLQLRQNLGHNIASSAILNASINVSAAVAVQTGSLLGGYFSIEGSGAITKAGDNDISALVAVINHTGGGVDNAFVAMMNGTGQTISEVIRVVCEHGTASVGIAIEKTANGTAIEKGLLITNATLGIELSLAAIGATGRIAKFVGFAANANFGDGYGAFEMELDLTGTLAGMVAAASTWINMGASSVGGSNLICVHNDGVYVPTAGAPLANATVIIGSRMQYVAEGGENPGALYLWSTNIFANALTALLHVNAAVDLSWASGAKSTNAASIPLFRDVTAGKTWYVNVYDG
jgi:hypothetical protein